MSLSNAATRHNITHQILKRRYGRLLNWRKPILEGTIGPCRPETFDRFASDLRVALETSVESLGKLTDDEFFRVYDPMGTAIDPDRAQSERM